MSLLSYHAKYSGKENKVIYFLPLVLQIYIAVENKPK